MHSYSPTAICTRGNTPPRPFHQPRGTIPDLRWLCNAGTIPCRTMSAHACHERCGRTSRVLLRANDGASALYSNQHSPFLRHSMDSYLHRNQIFLVGRRQEVRRFVSAGLHYIASISSHCKISRNVKHTPTSFSFGIFVSLLIVCHLQANGDLLGSMFKGEAKTVLE